MVCGAVCAQSGQGNRNWHIYSNLKTWLQLLLDLLWPCWRDYKAQSFSLRRNCSASSRGRSLLWRFYMCHDKCQRRRQGGWDTWSSTGCAGPGCRHHHPAHPFCTCSLGLWAPVLAPGPGLLTATGAENENTQTRSSFSEPVTNLVIPARAVTQGTQIWGICCSGQIVGIQGWLWVPLPLNKLVAALVVDIKRLVSPGLGGSFWAESFAVGTAQPALPWFSSQVSFPGKSCHHPLSFHVFPGVVDHGWVMPRALLPSWSPAFITDAFYVLWSLFLSSLTESSRQVKSH